MRTKAFLVPVMPVIFGARGVQPGDMVNTCRETWVTG